MNSTGMSCSWKRPIYIGYHFSLDCTGVCRFGFNGQEKDDEVSGTGNSMTAEFWEYDSRLGRRWNLDPKPDISLSRYSCFRNNPLLFSDVDGDTVRYSGFKEWFQVGLARLTSREFNNKIKTLQNSTNTYTYSNIDKRGTIGNNTSLGFIEETGSSQFNIHYTWKNSNWYGAHKNTVGASKSHALFEETYHAWDYEQGALGSGLSVGFDPNKGLNVIGAPSTFIQETSEARAWIWTVQNTRGKAEGAYYFDPQYNTTNYVWPTLYGIILKNPDETAVKRALFNSYTTEINEYEPGHVFRAKYPNLQVNGPYK